MCTCLRHYRRRVSGLTGHGRGDSRGFGGHRNARPTIIRTRVRACICVSRRCVRTESVQRDAVRGSRAKSAGGVHVATGEDRRNAREKRRVRGNAGKVRGRNIIIVIVKVVVIVVVVVIIVLGRDRGYFSLRSKEREGTHVVRSARLVHLT